MKFAILAAVGTLAASVAITAAHVIRSRKGEQWYYAWREETERILDEENKQSKEDKE